jgi:hypothetical protein
MIEIACRTRGMEFVDSLALWANVGPRAEIFSSVKSVCAEVKQGQCCSSVSRSYRRAI